jgi:hypothetical protein
MNYRGLKVVELDRKAVMRRFAKKFCKDISSPRVRGISYVIEYDDGCWTIQSSHRDDSESADTFRKAANVMGTP